MQITENDGRNGKKKTDIRNMAEAVEAPVLRNAVTKFSRAGNAPLGWCGFSGGK